MEENANIKEKKAGNKKQGISIPSILRGEILGEDFVVKQSKLIILIVFLSVLFISNRYSCLKKLSQIETLKRELHDAEYESLIISTKLTTSSRQSQIEALLKEKGIELSGAKTPVYEIKK